MLHLSISDDLTPEQLVSQIAQPEAVLFGPPGAVAGLADGARIGRDRGACEVAVLHPSVSAVHARVERTGAGWRIVDLGSRNGTAVAGVIARPDAPLIAGQPVRLGEIVLGFSLGIAPLPRRRRRATSPIALMAVTIETDEGTFEFSSAEVRGAAGAVALAPREVELVTALIARRRLHHPELAFVRGAELADSLGFQSIDADDENVRELVLRVRRKLRSIGGDRLIETRRNAGYRLAGAVGTPRPR